MSFRKITPTQLALFSRSPIVGAWWEELKSQGLFKDQRPDDTELDKQLFIAINERENKFLGRKIL